MKRIFINIGTAIIAIAMVLLMTELIIRIFVNKARYQFYYVTDSWITDDTLGWRYKPDFSSEDFLFGKLVHFNTNADGLRPASLVPEKKPGVRRVLLIGNSTVAGRAVPEEETIHYYLNTFLNSDNQQFEVLNAAVEGYATDQAFLQLHKLIYYYKPDYVAYGYCNNDLFGNLKKKDAAQYKPYFERTTEGYFLKLPIKNQRVRRMWGNQKPNKFLAKSALYGYFRPIIHKLRTSTEGGLRQVEGVDPATYTNSEKNKSEFLLFGFLLSEMNKLCKANNAQFIFYAHPDLKATWEPYRKALNVSAPPTFCEDTLSEIARVNGIHFVQMVNYFLRNRNRGPFHLLPYDGHCNGAGYRLQAEVLAQVINS